MLKIISPFLIAAICIFFTSCSTQATDVKPVAVATESISKEARVNEIDVYVKAIDNTQNTLELFNLTQITKVDLESEFPYWGQADFQTRNNQLVRSKLFSKDSTHVRKEWFYYKNNVLIMTRFYGTHLNDNQKRDTSTYYFEEGTLLMAKREGKGVLDVSKSYVKLQAIDLKKEGNQLQNIFNKQFASRDSSK